MPIYYKGGFVSKTVVYFPYNNDEGYVSESIPVYERDAYIAEGWFDSPAEFIIQHVEYAVPKPDFINNDLKFYQQETIVEANNEKTIEEKNTENVLIENEIVKPIENKKRGRPKKAN